MKITANREALKTLAQETLAGATAVGAPTDLAQNTAARIKADYQDWMGDPTAIPADTGKQGAYTKACGELTEARAARVEAIASGRKLCEDAIDALKAHLGRRWNPRWAAAGFGGFTLVVKDVEVGCKLEDLRNYFHNAPAHEVASKGITAVACEAARSAIIAATHARNAAKSAFQAARDARDLSVRKLKRRLSGLQQELGQILSADDSRWALFGFNRPIDGAIPARVKDVTITPGLPGTLLVRWESSPRAINYRVGWQLVSSGAEITQIGLFADTSANFTDLPSGAQIVVRISARNNSGETSVTAVPATVP